ncbi:hypothetical protein RRG08_010578 [Elysia crispata]|uniref:Uncharacterized protein n=1 Tax=Elysia crispata TaxID=231223 RepID=A0AAE1DMK0_9GAST|nr:hypothetical protein RRG08_010578 [Elysia crispata]
MVIERKSTLPSASETCLTGEPRGFIGNDRILCIFKSESCESSSQNLVYLQVRILCIFKSESCESSSQSTDDVSAVPISRQGAHHTAQLGVQCDMAAERRSMSEPKDQVDTQNSSHQNTSSARAGRILTGDEHLLLEWKPSTLAPVPRTHRLEKDTLETLGSARAASQTVVLDRNIGPSRTICFRVFSWELATRGVWLCVAVTRPTFVYIKPQITIGEFSPRHPPTPDPRRHVPDLQK